MILRAAQRENVFSLKQSISIVSLLHSLGYTVSKNTGSRKFSVGDIIFCEMPEKHWKSPLLIAHLTSSLSLSLNNNRPPYHSAHTSSAWSVLLKSWCWKYDNWRMGQGERWEKPRKEAEEHYEKMQLWNLSKETDLLIIDQPLSLEQNTAE